MADMIKFYKGLEASLPAAGTSGALYITTDEGAIYLGTGTGMKRLGDFVQVANVAALPAKAHENCLYYCVAENILAKWNGTEWKQVNKQPTTEELKTLLGLGTLAYKSEVAEADLNTDLAAKINASSAANHSHANKDELDLVATGDVAKWNAAEKNAKDYADGLNTAMNTRVEALEAVDHTHTNKALLDTYTQTEESLADAVAKKHEHANKTELDKIAAGDKAKWDAVVADHLTSTDKTALEDAIADVNTAVENEAKAARAAEKANADAITAIKDGTAVDSFADVETELAKKVDKVTGKSLVADTEITKLAGVSEGANKVEASENNGKIKIDGVETTVYTHPEKHAIAEVDGLGEALAGFQVKGDYAADDHKHVKADITDFAHTHTASEITDLDATIKAYDYATKTELGDVDAKFANYKTAADQKVIDDEQDRRLGVIEGDYLKAADIADFETKANVKKVADDLAAYVESNDAALAAETKARTDADAGFETRIAALEGNFGEGDGTVDAKIAAAVAVEKERAEGIEAGLRTDVNAIAADYLKGADKTTLEGKITAEKERAEGIEGGLRTDVDAIKADYLKAEDKTELSNAITAEKERAEGIEGGLRTDVNTIMGDYLKAADKTELEGKITTEETRAKGVEESLQTQINTIMNNPDAEGAINSINEFTQYVKDHGTIADGFRTDIDKNKEDIAANAKAIEDHETLAGKTYETKTDAAQKLTDAKAYTDTTVATEKTAREAADAELAAAIEAAKVEASNQNAVVLAEAQKHADQAEADAKAYADAEIAKDRARLVALEAIDHDAYTAADTALKNELEGKINAIDNHSHTNKDVLDSITADKVTSWDGKLDANGWSTEGGELAKSFAPDDNHTVTTRASDGGISVSMKNSATNVNSGVYIGAVNENSTGLSVMDLDIPNQIASRAVYNANGIAYSDDLSSDGNQLSFPAKSGTIALTSDVTALADNTYTKEQTYTKAEVDAAVEAAVTAATEWGSF